LCGVTVWLVLVGAAGPARAQSGEVGEWRHYGADGANTKYSPLDQITVTNFSDLEVAWRWTSISTEVASQRDSIDPGLFKATPLMVGGLLYVSTPLGQVAALDAGTGEAVWIYDPHSYDRIERPANIGWQHRGVSYWEDDESDDARVVIATHDLRLIAINARTGRLYPDFGENGTVDLSQSLGREIDSSRITHSTPVAVVRDTLVVGSTLEDRTTTREAPPGHVRGFDARTGAMKWIFHTIPQGDEFGVDSWQNGSWRYSGHTNVWGNMPVDEELGYVYLPVTTPTNDWYGGMRPGDNLFAESIVAVDAETGQRMWHFQAVHHGLWDYDFPTGGNLLDITVDGREIKAIAQTSKQAFTYVFDRVTGEPVWPIEERPVTAGTVPGEWYSPTQPFPTKPPAFDLQGITVDDLVDFTPELR
jgi:quinoprotein glucose dehydrogenase